MTVGAPPNDGWPEVWAQMTDSEIEDFLAGLPLACREHAE
jgi:hypothetical protein